jgi:hypothetical protein
MKLLRGAVGTCALLLLGASATPANAAWCNVFQVTCFHCGGRTSASYYAAPSPCCEPCQQQCCTTRYVQRCYYQPVTTYQTRTYYEPVTTYRTSYYYEPVTSYRYSSYYDPSTCCYQQVACPQTCYRLRSQCCPVQSWVQRCCSVPVTAYQQAFYYEPVTTCAPPPPCPCPTAPVAAAAPPPPDCAATAAPAAPPPGYGQQPSYGQQPGVTEPSRIPPAPGVTDYPPQNGAQTPYNRYYPPTYNDTMPPASGSSLQQWAPRSTTPQPKTNAPAPLPSVKLDRIAAGPAGEVRGQVVRDDKTPVPGAHVLFVCADRHEPRQTVATDAAGQFKLSLTWGDWLVYVQGADGKPVFHRKIEVRRNESLPVNLVSRIN